MSLVQTRLLRSPTADLAEDAHARSGGWADWLVIALVACLAVAGYIATYTHYLDTRVYPIVRSDGVGYYAYLPALLLERDPTFATFLKNDLHGAAIDTAGFHLLPGTRNVWVDQYPVGEAEMLLPFFTAGHKLARLAGQKADGYSVWEQGASGFAGAVYLVLGLIALRAVLRRYFTAGVTAATLAVLTFGTNLFHYATFDSLFSHVFSFCLTAALLWLALRWADRPAVWTAALIGFTAGLTVVVRNTNVILLLPVVTIGAAAVWRRRALPDAFGRQLLAALLAGAVAIFPMLLVWRLGTGHWIINSYQGAAYYGGFDLLHPHLPDAFWSFYKHGMLPWSPALALALLGVVASIRRTPVLGWTVLGLFLLQLYLIASWWSWYYGGGFGHRGFIDMYPLLALPLAGLFAAWRSPWARSLTAVAAVACCLLTVDLMLHYWKLELPFLGIAWPGYVRLLATFPPW